MPSTTSLVLIVALTVAVTVVLLMSYPRTLRDYFFEPIENARTVLGLLIGAVSIYSALKSGVAWMMVLALGGIAFGVAFVYYREPHKEIR